MVLPFVGTYLAFAMAHHVHIHPPVCGVVEGVVVEASLQDI
jgi:hypothetical protein